MANLRGQDTANWTTASQSNTCSCNLINAKLHMPLSVQTISHDIALDWSGLALDELKSLLCAVTVDTTGLVAERHTIALVGNMNNFRPESCADELRANLVRDGLEQRRDCGSVLRVQVGIDLVEDDHGAALRSLQGKDQAQRTQTYIL